MVAVIYNHRQHLASLSERMHACVLIVQIWDPLLRVYDSVASPSYHSLTLRNPNRPRLCRAAWGILQHLAYFAHAAVASFGVTGKGPSFLSWRRFMQCETPDAMHETSFVPFGFLGGTKSEPHQSRRRLFMWVITLRRRVRETR